MKLLLIPLLFPLVAIGGINDKVDLLTPRLPEKKPTEGAAIVYNSVLRGNIVQVTPQGIFLYADRILEADRRTLSNADRTIFVKGYPEKNAAEGQVVKVEAVRDGTVKFTDTNGADRTLENWKFVATSEEWMGEQ